MPPKITKGSMNHSSTLYESYAEYTCDIGYVDQYGHTSGYFTCHSTKDWKSMKYVLGSILNCQRKFEMSRM
jgi:hypothetical protein